MKRNAITGPIASVLLGAMVSAGVCAAAESPTPRSRAEVEAVLAQSPDFDADQAKPLNVVLLADVKDHGENAHDYPLWQKRWELLLGGAECSSEKQANLFGPPEGDKEVFSGTPQVTVTKAWHWPTEEQFADASVILAFCYLAWDDEKCTQMRQYLERGGGLVAIHPASWTRNKQYFPRAAGLLGIGSYLKFRHGPLDMRIVKPEHPLCAGLPKNIRFYDETYWPPTPIMEGVEALATSDEIVDDQGRKVPQPVLWTYRCGKGRVVGWQPGHFTWTFDDPFFRIVLLRGAAWAAGQSPYRFDSLVLRDARVSD